MKKKLLVAIILGSFFTNVNGQNKTSTVVPLITKVNDSKIIISQNAIVPANQTFYLRNTDGKLAGTFTGGQQVTWGASARKANPIADALSKMKSKDLNCYKIACPASAPAGSTCWECK